MSKTIMVGILGALVLVAQSFAVSADSGHEHGKGGSSGMHSGGHEGHGAAMPQATNLPGAWQALMAARDGIAADVESGALDNVHAKSEPLPALVTALLKQSGDLDAGKRVRVEGAAKQVTRIANSLHKAADAGDETRSRKDLSRLDGLLKLMRAQYPVGALDGEAQGHMGHAAPGGMAHGSHTHMDRPVGVVDAEPEAKISIRAFDALRFEPKRVEIQAGVPTRIELENIGAAEHSFVVKTPDGKKDWVHLHVAPGATAAATYQIDDPGTYRVICTIPGHTEGGMSGQLVVTARHGAGHSQH